MKKSQEPIHIEVRQPCFQLMAIVQIGKTRKTKLKVQSRRPSTRSVGLLVIQSGILKNRAARNKIKCCSADLEALSADKISQRPTSRLNVKFCAILRFQKALWGTPIAIKKKRGHGRVFLNNDFLLDEPITNIEFEIHRAYLKHLNIKTVDDVLKMPKRFSSKVWRQYV